MKLVDTSVAVDHLRGHAPARALLEEAVGGREELLGSELTRHELLAGARDDEMRGLTRFFAALTWVPVDAEIAETGGAFARQYRRTHPGIDDIDFLIAATATVTGAGLLTVNVGHFPMLQGLREPY